MDYRIPMNRLPIVLRLKDGGTKKADIFLHTASDAHSGSETVDEFLNSARSFIPCLLTDGSDPFMCNKQLIVAVDGVTGESAVLEPESEPTAIHRVRIGLASSGGNLEGELHVFLPEENCRVSDFLNSADAFFPLHRDDGTVSYVHSTYVEEVVPLEEGVRRT